MAAKHTPGPWHVSEPAADRQEAFAFSIRGQSGWAIAEVCKWPNASAANARLIAEAPAMRDALETFADGFAVLHSALKQSNYAADATFMRAWLDTFAEARALLARIDGGEDR